MSVDILVCWQVAIIKQSRTLAALVVYGRAQWADVASRAVDRVSHTDYTLKIAAHDAGYRCITCGAYIRWCSMAQPLQ